MPYIPYNENNLNEVTCEYLGDEIMILKDDKILIYNDVHKRGADYQYSLPSFVVIFDLKKLEIEIGVQREKKGKYCLAQNKNIILDSNQINYLLKNLNGFNKEMISKIKIN